MSSRAAELQRQVRENTEDYQSYLKSLYKWEEEIKVKDDMLRKAPRKSIGQEFPIRTKRNEETQHSSCSIGEAVAADGALPEHQAKQKAALEKNKGNDYFKEGKYDKAVECYSAAMMLDPTDAILPANRAIAYLKLNKFTEAEADCTKSLSLDPNFVKAYHRRGTARANTGRPELAKEDFEKVLSLEPHNKAAQQELERLQKLAGSSVTNSTSTVANQQGSKKKVVCFSESVANEEEPVMKPTKTVRYKNPAQSPADLPLQHPSLTFVEDIHPVQNSVKTQPVKSILIATVNDKKQEQLAIEKLLSSFHATKAESLAPSKSPISTVNGDKKIPPAPRNYIQLAKEWKRLLHNRDSLYQYVKQIDPSKLPDILRESLENDVLGGIISVLRSEFVKREEPVLPWLLGLSKVKRIAAVILFLSTDEKSDLEFLINWTTERGDGSEEERQAIVQRFS